MRWRFALVGVALAACSGPRGGLSLDAGLRRDGASLPDGALGPTDAGYERPDALRLPPADLEVTLPFEGPEATTDLEASAALGRLDVVFSIDATGSYGGEIDELQGALVDVVVPGLTASVPDVAFAVVRFEDVPFAPFGEPSDRAYTLLTPMTTDAARVQGAVAQLDSPLGSGGDEPEAGIEALYQIARGTGLVVDGEVLAAPWSGQAAGGGGSDPGVGFRSDAFRVVVHATDAPSHDASDYAGVVPGAHGRAETLSALSAAHVRVIGIASSERARPDLESFARATGAVVAASGGRCLTGIRGAARSPDADGTCPLVYDIDENGVGLSRTVVQAIGAATDALTYDEVWGEPVDDRLGFVRAIEAVSATPPAGGTAPRRADRRPAGDGVDDTFEGVRSGTMVVFTAHLANTTVEPADYEQVFRVTIALRGDGLELVRRTIRIVVPRGRLDAGRAHPDTSTSDAGLDDAATDDAATDDAATDDAGIDDAATDDARARDAGP
ncbi:MAG: hypothetical protein U0234_11175 [Sandaracinus sp.]